MRPHSALGGRTHAGVHLWERPELAGGVGNLVGGSQSSRFAAPPLRSGPSGDGLPPTTSLLAMAGRELPAMNDPTDNAGDVADTRCIARRHRGLRWLACVVFYAAGASWDSWSVYLLVLGNSPLRRATIRCRRAS